MQKKRNDCQLGMLPFISQLSKFFVEGKHFFIQEDTFTKQKLELVGVRCFDKDNGIYNSGFYIDSLEGASDENYNVINKRYVGNKEQYNAISHEVGHWVHQMFDKNDRKTLSNLYKKAIKEDLALDFYAATNMYEYFAQGCEAFTSFYKPHFNIIFSYNYNVAHTIYELMDKDPDLHKFIGKVLKKYI